MNEILTAFIVSIVAGIVCHYICKWLDRDNQGNQPEE